MLQTADKNPQPTSNADLSVYTFVSVYPTGWLVEEKPSGWQDPA